MEEGLQLEQLLPSPEERWRHMLRFVGWDEASRQAAARSIEILFRRGHELVVNTYDYLRSVPETASILGWEENVDERHLEERRRFFTLWLARTLGLDTSDEFAHYLFRAGKYHAGHGPRRIHVPAQYVIASIGLVQASFNRFMAEAGMDAHSLAQAGAAWSKYLSVQLDMMLLGYQAAKEAEHGDFAVHVQVFGRLRPLIGRDDFQVYVDRGSTVAEALRKFFNYFPQARQEALQPIWRSQEKKDSLWVEVYPSYIPRPAWRVLLNGRDLAYAGGFHQNKLKESDVLALFPPGR
ncbi:MAG: protoglobin domain-containing protein [Anaerolineales bacterium]